MVTVLVRRNASTAEIASAVIDFGSDYPVEKDATEYYRGDGKHERVNFVEWNLRQLEHGLSMIKMPSESGTAVEVAWNRRWNSIDNGGNGLYIRATRGPNLLPVGCGHEDAALPG